MEGMLLVLPTLERFHCASLRRPVEAMEAWPRGTTGMNMEPIVLTDIVCKAMARLDLKIKRKNAVIQYSAPDERILITGDMTHLTGAIENLIDNALKYCNGN